MNILFFASIREQLDCESETMNDLETIRNAEDLRQSLMARGEPWQSVLSNQNIIVSVNQEVADWSTPLSLNDEVAFFPPVTGG